MRVHPWGVPPPKPPCFPGGAEGPPRPPAGGGGAAGGRATSCVVVANGRHLCILALNRVSVVAVTTILVIGHHVPCRYDFMFPRRSYHARLRARGVRGALLPGRRVWGGLRPPQGSRGVWGAARPPIVEKKLIAPLSIFLQKN